MAHIQIKETCSRKNSLIRFSEPGPVLVPHVYAYLSAMSAVVEYEAISGLRVFNQLGQTPSNVFPCGLRQIGITVQHHQHVIFVETEALQEQLLHAPHVISTSMELTLGSGVIAPHQQRPLRHTCFVAFRSTLLLYSATKHIQNILIKVTVMKHLASSLPTPECKS